MSGDQVRGNVLDMILEQLEDCSSTISNDKKEFCFINNLDRCV